MSEAEQTAEPEFRALSVEDKKRLMQCGIFFAILLILFGVLVFFTIVSRSSWQRGLEQQVAQTLSEHQHTYTIVDKDVLDSPFVSSAASFLVTNGDSATPLGASTEHAVIVRVPTLFGPLPAVYLYTEGEKTATFVAFATLDGKARAAVEANAKNAQIAYWATRIPKIVGDRKVAQVQRSETEAGEERK